MAGGARVRTEKRYSGLNVLIAKLHLDCECSGEDKDIAGISADESSVDLEDAEPRQCQVVAVEGVSSASDVEIVSSTCAKAACRSTSRSQRSRSEAQIPTPL